MMTPFQKLKAAEPQAARHLLEVSGHIFAHDRGALAAWARRVGVSLDELDRVTREFRDGLDHGRRTPHVEY